MAGHGSPPAKNQAEHPNRKVGRDTVGLTRDSLAHWKAIGNAPDITGQVARSAFRAGDVAPFPTRQEAPRQSVRFYD